MSLLVREVGRFLFEAAVWLGAAVAIAALVIMLAARFTDRVTVSRTAIGWAVAGAAVVASLAVRLDAPLTQTPDIGTRPLPLLWLFGGAVLTTIVLAMQPSRTDQQPDV